MLALLIYHLLHRGQSSVQQPQLQLSNLLLLLCLEDIFHPIRLTLVCLINISCDQVVLLIVFTKYVFAVFIILLGV